MHSKKFQIFIQQSLTDDFTTVNLMPVVQHILLDENLKFLRVWRYIFLMEMTKQSLFYQLKIAEKNVLAFIFVVYVLLHFFCKKVKV